MEEPTLEGLVASLGGAVETPAPEPEATPPEPEATPPVETPAAEDGAAPDGTEATPATAAAPAAHPDAAAREAFIHMRKQNKRMSDVLKNVAGVIGVENVNVDDENQLLEALQQKIVTEQSAKSNIPVEFLQEFQALKAREQQVLASQREHDTAIGLQTLQNKYGLKQEELNSFVQDLVRENMNPLTTTMNLIQEYQRRNFDTIVAKEAAKAVAAEQTRASKASTHSTNPGSQSGSGAAPGDTGKVENVRDLESWLKANSK